MHVKLQFGPATVQGAGVDSGSVRFAPGDSEVKAGVALCLSGGGYAGMLFNAGSLWRLNELGWLRRLDEISCVSAGAIAGATLGAAWDRLDFDAGGVARRFVPEVVGPIKRLARETLDMWSIVGGEISERSCGAIVADAYDECLFGGITLQQIPDCDSGGAPRFVFTSLDVRTGRLVKFSRAGMLGENGGADPSRFRLAIAIAAATAFPPMMPPVALASRDLGCGDGTEEKFTLVDAAVCDSLGLEGGSGYRTLLISDGHLSLTPAAELEPGWFQLASRLVDVVRERDRKLRKDWLRRMFDLSGESSGEWRTGADWHPGPELAGEDLPRTANGEADRQSGEVVRLEAMPECRQEQWLRQGYAACDAALSRSGIRPGRGPNCLPITRSPSDDGHRISLYPEKSG